MIRSVLLLLFISVFLRAGAQNDAAAEQQLRNEQVPALIIQTFTRNHPGESGSWFRDGDHFRVEFIQRSSRVAHTITYDENGNVVKRDSEAEENKKPERPGTDRYLQPSDTSGRSGKPSPPSEVLRVEDAGMPPAPENKAWRAEDAAGDRAR